LFKPFSDVFFCRFFGFWEVKIRLKSVFFYQISTIFLPRV